jgi:drug/metabolite transporter (DMT)-like permease
MYNMYFEIAGKIASESLLSLYPVFVKNIQLPIFVQLWSRFFTYVIISAFFVDWSVIWKHLFSKTGLALSAATLVHVFTSYRGFLLLESGIAYALFYTYPLMILFMAGEMPSAFFVLVVLGILLLVSKTENKTDHSSDLEGYGMIALAAFSEAIIYFLVRNIQTDNNWNHLFLSYAIGLLMLSGWDSSAIFSNLGGKSFSYSLGINSVIGLAGYYLRFFAASRLKPSLYAPLSYVGIVMAYLYGFIFSDEMITWQKVVGTLLILGGIFMQPERQPIPSQ